MACEDGCPNCVRRPDLRARLDRPRALALLRDEVLVRREEAEPSPPWLTLGAS